MAAQARVWRAQNGVCSAKQQLSHLPPPSRGAKRLATACLCGNRRRDSRHTPTQGQQPHTSSRAVIAEDVGAPALVLWRHWQRPHLRVLVQGGGSGRVWRCRRMGWHRSTARSFLVAEALWHRLSCSKSEMRSGGATVACRVS